MSCPHTIGTAVDEDGCCVSCGADLNHLVCPKCNGKGFVHWSESGEEMSKPCGECDANQYPPQGEGALEFQSNIFGGD